MTTARRAKRASLSSEATHTQESSLTSRLRMLADPTRMRIFLFLRQGEACVCELASSLDLAENLVSHHLGVLRRAGLVSDRRDASDARWVYYTLDASELGRLREELGALFDPRTLGMRAPSCGPATNVAAPVRLTASFASRPVSCDQGDV